MNYFTSDWHFLESRNDVFYRPEESHIIDSLIVKNLVKLERTDNLYVIGDVIGKTDSVNYEHSLKMLKAVCSANLFLIPGNYDNGTFPDGRDKLEVLSKYFQILQPGMFSFGSLGYVYIDHYPVKCKEFADSGTFCLTGHIHSLWKVKPNIINVGVDAWHFKPVSEEQLVFCKNAMLNHYDENVFMRQSLEDKESSESFDNFVFTSRNFMWGELIIKKGIYKDGLDISKRVVTTCYISGYPKRLGLCNTFNDGYCLFNHTDIEGFISYLNEKDYRPLTTKEKEMMYKSLAEKI